MGIATFENEIERAEYERYLDEVEKQDEKELENDADYQAWCEEQIKVSKILQEHENNVLQRHLTKTELLPERAN